MAQTITDEQRATALADLEAVRPRTPDELDRFVRRVLGLRVPRRAVVPGNDAPLDYLIHAFFEGMCPGDPAPAVSPGSESPGCDVVVWAARGGGKTMLGAVATLLDLLFKPGITVRILGGSREQSGRMFEHLRRFAQRPAIAPLLASPPTRQRLELVTGGVAELSAQSQRSVRGVRVQKLRCDEVDLFDRAVWQAAQLTTRSAQCGEVAVRGAVEAMSTMHEVGGLMSELVERPGLRVLRWSAIDVAERCPPARPCAGCVLWDDCAGLAKEADGFVPVGDLVQQFKRTSNPTWQAEMMCLRPSTEHSVFASFDPTPGGRHVPADDRAGRVSGSALVAGVKTNHRDTRESVAQTHRDLLRSGSVGKPCELIAGLDFGLRNPLVMLWARFWPGRGVEQPADPRLGLIEIVDEHHELGLTLDQHLRLIGQHDWPMPAWVGVDPAGGARNSQTGISDIRYMQNLGYRIRNRRMAVRHGLDRVRRRFDRDTLRIAPHCTHLIEALRRYRYPARRPEAENPLKDGPDHACDALRYLVVNLELGPAAVETRRY